MCLEFANHNFIVSCITADIEAKNASHALEIDETMACHNNANEHFEAENTFTICNSDTDCLDYDGYANDSCNLTIRICENKNKHCSNCEHVSIKITPSNYPDKMT